MKKPFTKIIATLGPETSSKERIEELVKAGVNVFRLNFSHGTIENHEKNVRFIRQIEKKLQEPLGIIGDLQGPKLRVGEFEHGSVFLKQGQTFSLDLSTKKGNEERASLPHPEIFKALKPDTYLLLNDGLIRLRVVSCNEQSAQTVVVDGGILSDHKGVNVPGVTLPLSALTKKDLSDLKAALNMGVDWIALSFVQRPEDIIKARKLIGTQAHIITKVEKPSALESLKDIVNLSDAIMVARGDLGVETPLEKLPALQKHIVELCRRQGKPVIIATQMLESMIKNPTPTRAEVSDIATAVYDGVDAVMLSGETAVGTYPVLAVSVMRKVITNIEADPFYKKSMDVISLPPDHLIASAVTSALPSIAKVLNKPSCVVTYSMSGSTTLRVARERVGVPIVNLTCECNVVRRMALVWGVHSFLVKKAETLQDVIPIALKIVQEHSFAKSGEEIIMTAGMPLAKKGTTNLIHILTVE